MTDHTADLSLGLHLSKADQRPIDLDDLIANLAGQHAHLARYIDRRWDGLDPRRLARLLTTYGQSATRLGRLLRDRDALYKPVDRQLAEIEALLERAQALIDEPPPDDRSPAQPPSAPVDDGDDAFLDIDDIITALAGKQARLLQHLDRLWCDPDAEPPDRLLAVYSHNAARLGRLLRDRCAIYGQPADDLSLAMDAALDHLSQEWGIPL